MSGRLPQAPLSRASVELKTVELMPLPKLAGHLPDLTTAIGERHGTSFRSVRVEFGLTLREVAEAWGVGVLEVADLERGRRRFRCPADYMAALQQLLRWACERNNVVRLAEPYPGAAP